MPNDPATLEKALREMIGENSMLLNAVQRAQQATAEGRCKDADDILSDVIRRVLELMKQP